MTTPGGVPNLPAGALTEETLAEKLQDMSAAAMRSRARERMPSIFDDSTGGNILSDLTPFGLLTRIWAEVNSLIANADPADIQGPQDIPQLLLDFIQGLPVIGELVGLLEAILGEYDGDDEVLLAIQQIFAPIRKLVQLVAGQDVGFPTIEDVTSGWTALADALENVPGLGQIVGLVRSFGAALLGAVPVGIITDDTPSMLVEGGYDVPDTIHPDSDFQWRDEGVPGTTPLGSAWVDADGADHSDATEVMPVGADWELEIGTHVKWVSLAATAGQDAIRLNVLPYVDSQTPHPSGAVMVASVESPSGDSSSDKDGWVEIVGTWSPPEGVTHFAVEKHVTSAASSGSVGFDETYVKATQKLPQKYTHNLPEDLSSLFNWIGLAVDTLLDALGETPVGPILDRIFDLGAALEGVAQDAWGAATDVVQLMSALLTDPASVIGTIPQSLVGGLETTLNQIGDIFNGMIVTPVNSIVSAIKDWFDQWFGGGSSNAIPLAQKDSAWGVAPLDGNRRVPPRNLPVTLQDIAENGLPPGGGGGDPVERTVKHVLIALGADQAVPNDSPTTLTGLTQISGETVTFDATHSKWSWPIDGYWDITAQVAFEDSATGERQAAVYRTTASGDVIAGAGSSSGGPWKRCLVTGSQDVTNSPPMGEDDEFSLQVWQNSGAALDVVGGYPNGTYVLALYRGEKKFDAPPAAVYVRPGSGSAFTGAVKLFEGVETEVFAGEFPAGMVLDSDGNLYAAALLPGRIIKRDTDGVETTLAFTSLGQPYALAIDTSQNLYTIDTSDNTGRVLKLSGTSTVTQLPFSGLNGPRGIAVDAIGNVYVANAFADQVLRLSTSNTQSTMPFSGLNRPWGLAVDASGALYVADRLNHRIVKMDSSNTQTVLPFTGLNEPRGVAVDAEGNIYVTDGGNNRVVKLDPNGTQTVLPFTDLGFAPVHITVG